MGDSLYMLAVGKFAFCKEMGDKFSLISKLQNYNHSTTWNHLPWAKGHYSMKYLQEEQTEIMHSTQEKCVVTKFHK